MGNVNMPTPVALAGGALCLLAGYLIGGVTAPDTASRTTATVATYDSGSGELCLAGDAIKDLKGVVDGKLCGTWRRSTGATTPHEGDRFRFVAQTSSDGDNSATYIYGDVER